jgi:hypothetical protein
VCSVSVSVSVSVCRCVGVSLCDTAGRFSPGGGTACDACVTRPGWFCPPASATAGGEPCPEGTYSVGGALTASCTPCGVSPPRGYYCSHGSTSARGQKCGAGLYSPGAGLPCLPFCPPPLLPLLNTSACSEAQRAFFGELLAPAFRAVASVPEWFPEFVKSEATQWLLQYADESSSVCVPTPWPGLGCDDAGFVTYV